MSPIRVALIGLSASAKTSWAAEGHLPYLLSQRGKAKYTIVALLNSSVQKAKQAREHFSLPENVKTYGSAADLANDLEIDLIVCNTRVDTHSDLVLPSVKTGKYVFVEWPLAHSAEKAKELVEELRAEASIVGLQGRVSPPISKVKELIRNDRIGKVLSSDVHTFGNLGRREAYSQGLSYFAERSVGGNPANIAFGHMIDFVHDTLGEFKWFNTRMQIQRPELGVVNDMGENIGTMTSDVPDLISLSGPLIGGNSIKPDHLANDATLTVTYRNGPSFPGTPGFIWAINGVEGEIRLTAPGPYLQSDSYRAPVNIDVHDYKSDEVDRVDWDWEEWQKDLPIRARNVAQLYERFAEWFRSSQNHPRNPAELADDRRWPQFKDATVRHLQIQKMYDTWDGTKD